MARAVLLSCMLSLACAAAAQSWTPIRQFPGYISFVKMERNGIMYLATGISPEGEYRNIHIYRSFDRGDNWSESQTPVGIGGKLSDLIAMDNGTAYATLWTDQSHSGLWISTDTGASWRETTVHGAFTSIHATPSRLILTDLFDKTLLSVDGGLTFTKLAPNSINHVCFLDSLHGAMSTFRGASFWFTSDGGQSWAPSNQNLETWSIGVDTLGGSLFIAPEGPDGYHAEIFRSSDVGHTWSAIGRLAFGSTGHLEVSRLGNLYTQVHFGITPGYSGVYESTDHGLSWQSIGGPSSNNDTRFCTLSSCKGTTVFAFDEKNPGTLFRNGAASADLYYSSYFTDQRTAVDSELRLPLSIRLPLKYQVDKRHVLRAQFSLEPDSDNLEIEGFSAPKGWKLASLSNTTHGITATISHTASTSITDSCVLGTLSLHALRTGATTVSLRDLLIEDDSGSTAFCAMPEGDVVSYVTIQDRLALKGEKPHTTIEVDGTRFPIDFVDDSAVYLKLVTATGVVVDDGFVRQEYGVFRYYPPRTLHGPYFLITSSNERSEVLRVLLR